MNLRVQLYSNKIYFLNVYCIYLEFSNFCANYFLKIIFYVYTFFNIHVFRGKNLRSIYNSTYPGHTAEKWPVFRANK